MSEQVSASHIHKLALARLYHEDQLLAQRTYNYLTINVFLMMAMTFGYAISPLALNSFISLFGAFISVLQSAFGRRTETAIDFWRVYVKLIEQAARIPLDHLLFSFYETGQAETPWGNIGKQKRSRPVVFQTLPWSRIHSTNTMIGVFLPLLIGTVWFSAAFALFYRDPRWVLHRLVAWLVPLAWLVAVVFTLVWSKPASPQPSRPLGVSPRRGVEMLLAVIRRPRAKG